MNNATIDPSDEARQAIVDRINTATTFSLLIPADYGRIIIDELEEITCLQVDVVHQDQTQLNETLDIEDRSSHFLIVWVREKLPDIEKETLKQRMLILRQVFQRLNNFNSADGRVKVWDCGYTDTSDPNREENPSKSLLLLSHFFKAFVKLRVEVEAP
jgi:hypothetical protein